MKSYDGWSALIDLLEIAANELERDGHTTLAKKLEVESAILSRDTELGK